MGERGRERERVGDRERRGWVETNTKVREDNNRMNTR